VCGEDDHLWRVADKSGWFLVCFEHWKLLTDTASYKSQIEAMGVVFGEKPMDVNYKDEDFLRDCGIKNVELWEWEAAKHDDHHELFKKRTKPDRKL